MRSNAIGSAFIDVEEDSRGVMEVTILNIVVENIEGRVKKVKIFLILVSQDINHHIDRVLCFDLAMSLLA
ncbi:unnamed protein product [Clavelina lepadiformis]|uniref:Uncharacterized protein n=1 Tax=Clavelina lepadiformis TaxID=159417 RepID=A0ABP0GA48_CLALP